MLNLPAIPGAKALNADVASGGNFTGCNGPACSSVNGGKPPSLIERRRPSNPSSESRSEKWNCSYAFVWSRSSDRVLCPEKEENFL